MREIAAWKLSLQTIATDGLTVKLGWEDKESWRLDEGF